jgi:hypothetical protein
MDWQLGPSGQRVREAEGAGARRSSSLKTSKEMLAGLQKPANKKSGQSISQWMDGWNAFLRLPIKHSPNISAAAGISQYGGSPRTHRRLLPTPPAEDQQLMAEDMGRLNLCWIMTGKEAVSTFPIYSFISTLYK